MKTLIVGGGPAGLYLAYLLKRQSPRARVRVVEQNDADSTFGFGVVFSERALDFLRDDDPDTHELLMPALQRWRDLSVSHRGERITIDGVGFAAIGRLALLRLLQQRARSVGVEPEYGCLLSDAAALEGHDLVVAADGANSFVRKHHEAAFGTRVEPLANRFVWYGTPRHFDSLSQTFVQTPAGHFNAHHYRYSADMSTFIVECDPATWERAGFGAMDEAGTRACCEQIFGETLGGRGLVTNKSIWRSFPKVTNRRWSLGNRVLIGDALRTAHFSIGSGTRLALEDAIALARAVREHPGHVAAALRAFEAARRPVVDKLVDAANASAAWYDDFPAHMRLAPWDLAWSYIQRSGRVDAQRLRQSSPRFVAGYEARGHRS